MLAVCTLLQQLKKTFNLIFLCILSSLHELLSLHLSSSIYFSLTSLLPFSSFLPLQTFLVSSSGSQVTFSSTSWAFKLLGYITPLGNTISQPAQLSLPPRSRPFAGLDEKQLIFRLRQPTRRLHFPRVFTTALATQPSIYIGTCVASRLLGNHAKPHRHKNLHFT